MGKTYEALKKAEAEREQRPDVPVEANVSATPAVPVAASSSWFRRSRKPRNGHKTTNGNGHGNGNGNGNGNGARASSTDYANFSFEVPPTISEEFQQLRKNILATKSERQLQFLLFVSSRHGEGSTTT